ncbi:unnamed protein product [Lampetra fluviatilis]
MSPRWAGRTDQVTWKMDGNGHQDPVGGILDPIATTFPKRDGTALRPTSGPDLGAGPQPTTARRSAGAHQRTCLYEYARLDTKLSAVSQPAPSLAAGKPPAAAAARGALQRPRRWRWATRER